MNHYIAYHKTDVRGPYFEEARRRQDRELRFTTKKHFRDGTLVGNRLWVITSRASPKVYELACSGIVQRIERGSPENEVVFNVDYFPEPIDVTRIGWFQTLMTHQSNFRNGLNRITDPGDVSSLEAVRADGSPDHGAVKTTGGRSAERLPAETFNPVTAEHIWHALEKLREPSFKHAYGPSTDFDLVTDDGERFPPKAVFGLAASEALGFDILPKHFSGGRGTICFRILEGAGFTIVSKDEESHPIDIPTSPEDRLWTEGKPRLVAHLRKERASGLAQAKKDWFERIHGRLFCEECGMDAVEVYDGPHGAACIEVHHKSVQVQDMVDGQKTKLEDLQCLCANCHRVAHRLLKLELEMQDSPINEPA